MISSRLIIIDNVNEININHIKRCKASVILRNQDNKFKSLEATANKLKKNRINFYVYNKIKDIFKYKTNYLYISAHNKKPLKHIKLINKNIIILGAAHNYEEIFKKINQGCDIILLSRIFKSQTKSGFLGLHRFNLLRRISPIPIIALGGINAQNIKKIKVLKKLYGVCVLSAGKNREFKF